MTDTAHIRATATLTFTDLVKSKKYMQEITG